MRDRLLNFFCDRRTIGAVWLLIVIVAFLTKGAFNPAKCNNFLIFCGVFDHTVDSLPLYVEYPQEYGDVNHYGPLFSLIIAPFALLPRVAGLFLWDLALAALLFYSIRRIPVSEGYKAAICWIVTLELLSALQMQQFNIAIASLILLTYLAARDDRPGLAALFIVIGTLTKLYGIVGLAFLPFMRRKWRFLGWLALWSAVLFIAPMAISSPGYIVGEYGAWFASIVDKNAANSLDGSLYQNISAIGMIHRVSRALFSDLWILIPAVILFLLPYCRRRLWSTDSFQWGILASALMCVILYSTGSESSGYVIAFLGIALWYLLVPPFSAAPGDERKRSRVKTLLLIFALIVCGLGGSDLMPSAIRKGLIRQYSLKALPVLLIWLYLTFTLLRGKLTAKEEK